MAIYGLMADVHAHNWTAFSSIGEDGVNSRLSGLIKEIVRCAQEVKAVGGHDLIIAGDLFHVRGSVSPSVLNPIKDCFQHIVDDLGVCVYVIAGNHDLEGKHSNRLGSAITALDGMVCAVAQPTVVNIGGRRIACAPWYHDLSELREVIGPSPKFVADDIILHAPIDGTIEGLPDHGLTAEYLADIKGDGRVFAGHYHHHKDFGNGVYSIGALAHNSWSDVGSKAGFLIVNDDEVRWYKSHLPEFVDISDDIDQADAELMAEGNYVRVKVSTTKTSEINAIREMFIKAGAKGVVIQSIKAPAVAREGAVSASVSSGASLEVSVAEFVKSKSFANEERVALECQRILAEAVA